MDEEIQKHLATKVAGEEIKKLSQIYVARAFDNNLSKNHEGIVKIGFALVLGGLSVLRQYSNRTMIKNYLDKLVNELWEKVH